MLCLLILILALITVLQKDWAAAGLPDKLGIVSSSKNKHQLPKQIGRVDGQPKSVGRNNRQLLWQHSNEQPQRASLMCSFNDQTPKGSLL